MNEVISVVPGSLWRDPGYPRQGALVPGITKQEIILAILQQRPAPGQITRVRKSRK